MCRTAASGAAGDSDKLSEAPSNCMTRDTCGGFPMAKHFLVVEGPQVKGVLVTIFPSSFLGARLLLRDAGIKVERPERSEDERP